MDEILTRIENEILKKNNIKYSYIEGTGIREYDEPDKLVFKCNSYQVELSIKLGSSWYISNGSGIRIFTIGIKRGKFDRFYTKSYRYLDVTCDDDLLIKWIKSMIPITIKSSIITNDLLECIKSNWKNTCSKVTDILNKSILTYKHGIVKTPKITYHYDDMFDEVFDMEIVEIKLPTVSSDQAIKSIIFQVRKNNLEGNIELYMNLRSLTQDNPPLLINISNEIKIDKDNIGNVIKSEFKKYIIESIYPRIPTDIREKLEKVL